MSQCTALALQEYFASNATLPYKFRYLQLTKLKTAIQQAEAELLFALQQDLAKPALECYIAEFAAVYHEINYAIKQLKSWLKPHKVRSPLALFPSKSYINAVPRGVVLIITAWNYPVQLMLIPLIGALAAGNCVILKLTEYMPATTAVLTTLISSTFASNYITTISGAGSVVIPRLIDSSTINYVFFTGSSNVGKQIAVQCAAQLIPYTLELGGKSPVVVDRNVDLAVACKRIAWGKIVNAGQTCIAPDYILVHQDIKTAFVKQLITTFDTLLANNTEYTQILNDSHFQRLKRYLAHEKIIYGHVTQHFTDKFLPIIIDEPQLTSAVMQEEIFGPILPILSFTDTAQIKTIINHNPQPLALYVFSKNLSFAHQLITQIACGGACINTTLMHAANIYLPFGGIGNSGQGNYHGKYTFMTFSHHKSVLQLSTWFDAFIKYPPYNKLKLFLIRCI